MPGKFRLIKVDLAPIHIDMLNQLVEARGAVTRSALIRDLILDAFRMSDKPVPMNPERKSMSVPAKTSSGEFLAEIDTGSDHTVVPEKYAAGFTYTRTKAIWTFGTITQRRLYKGEIEVMGEKIQIENVLLASGDVGILGLDVIERFDISIEGGKVVIKPI